MPKKKKAGHGCFHWTFPILRFILEARGPEEERVLNLRQHGDAETVARLVTF
jgi:hypothetical protein